MLTEARRADPAQACGLITAALLLLAPCEGRAREDHWIGHAVLVGVSDISWKGNDAAAMREALLRDSEHWCESNITLLIDSDATYENVDDALAEMADRACPDDVCLFLFSGHGGPTLYDCPEYRRVPYWISTCPSAHKCVIVDSCRSGEMIDSLSGAQGVVCMTSATRDQLSYSAQVLHQGVFAFYVIEALGQACADTDGDGMTSAEEAFEYARPAVLEWDLGQEPSICDSHPGPLCLVARGDGMRRGPVTPLHLPLGGGLWLGALSCTAPEAVGGPGRELPAALAALGLVACLRRRRRGPRAAALPAASWFAFIFSAAGCAGGGAATLDVPGGAALRPVEGGASTLASSYPPRSAVRRTRPCSHPELPDNTGWWSAGVVFPMDAKGTAYWPGPEIGLHARSGDQVSALELGASAALAVSADGTVLAGLGRLHADIVITLHPQRHAPRFYVHGGARMLGNAMRTDWPRNPVLEYDNGFGLGAGLIEHSGQWDVRASWTVPHHSRNLQGFLTLSVFARL